MDEKLATKIAEATGMIFNAAELAKQAILAETDERKQKFKDAALELVISALERV